MAPRQSFGNKFTKAMHAIGKFFLEQLGYACNENRKLDCLYLAPATLLICYTMISLRALIFTDILSLLINLIWSAQIITNAILQHIKTINNRRKEEDEIRQNGEVLVAPAKSAGTSWGRCLIIYVVLMLMCLVLVVSLTVQGIWTAYGCFSIAAYFIAFLDGGIDILVGLYGASEN